MAYCIYVSIVRVWSFDYTKLLKNGFYTIFDNCDKL